MALFKCLRHLMVFSSSIYRALHEANVTKCRFKCRHLCSWARTTVDEEEVEKLSRSSNDWWDPNGEFAPLHSMNKLRVSFVKESLHHLNRRQVRLSSPLRDLRILDVGCGGGILSEPLARLGAQVTGIDASPRNIHGALQHACHDPLVAGRVRYRCMTVEQFAEEEQDLFDCVIASEVIEHISDKDTFFSASSHLIKPGGTLVITTINRTARSYAAAVLVAEYIFRLLTPGTHDWNKFATVTELRNLVTSRGLQVLDVKGMFYLPIFNKWCWTNDKSVNYALSATKPKTASEEQCDP